MMWSSQQKLRPRYRDQILRKTVANAMTVKAQMIARHSSCRLSTIVPTAFAVDVRRWKEAVAADVEQSAVEKTGLFGDRGAGCEGEMKIVSPRRESEHPRRDLGVTVQIDDDLGYMTKDINVTAKTNESNLASSGDLQALVLNRCCLSTREEPPVYTLECK